MKLLRDSQEGSLSSVACLETRLVRIKNVVVLKVGGEWIKDSSLESFGKKGKKQSCQLSRFRRVTHAFACFHRLSRHTSNFSRQKKIRFWSEARSFLFELIAPGNTLKNDFKRYYSFFQSLTSTYPYFSYFF